MKTTPVLPVIALAFAMFIGGYTFGTRNHHPSFSELWGKSNPNGITTNLSYQPSPPIKTNIVDNGLGAWLAETNHHFGPWAAKSLYVMQLPDGKFYIRFKNVNGTNAEFQTFFVHDQAYETADDARRTFSINTALQVKKAVSDALEDACK